MKPQRTYRFHPELRRPPLPKQPRRAAPYDGHRQGWAGNTPAQDEVLAYILLSLEEGFSPSLEQVRVRMGWKYKSSAKSCLLRLQEAGRLPANFCTKELFGQLDTL